MRIAPSILAMASSLAAARLSSWRGRVLARAWRGFWAPVKEVVGLVRPFFPAAPIMGIPGLELIAQAGKKFGLKVVTEVMDLRKVDLVAQHADILQIGARNMQNYDLLHEVGQSGKPVLLKRGLSARYEEWLMAAEHIASSGNERIILCERGVRSFETGTRNMLDLAAVPVMQGLAHLPVIVDPSQATGKRELIVPMSLAAIAAGADGLIIEVHANPDQAIKDGAQSLSPAQFDALVPQVQTVANAVGRTVLMPARV